MRGVCSTLAGTRELPRRPPSPVSMLRMEEGPEEGGPPAAVPGAGSGPEAGRPCPAPSACLWLPGACASFALRGPPRQHGN